MTVIFLCFISIIPVVMVIIGFFWWRKAPENMNTIFGYSSKAAMRSRETWNYAHRVFGRSLVKFGIGLEILSGVLLLLFRFNPLLIIRIILLVQVVIMLLPTVLTEIAIRQNFDKYGKRKIIDIYV